MSTDPKGFTRKWMLANHQKPAAFKQELFDTVFSKQTLQKHIEELKNSIDIELYVSSRVTAEDFYIDIEVFSHKHPHIPINLNRIVLLHPCHNDDSNILIFVKDVKMANGKCDPERTIKQYETLFRNKNIDQSLITFMPVSKLYNDYVEHEQRRKLAFMFDQFIVDRKLAVKVNAFLGTRMLNDGRAAFPIDFSDQSTLADTVHKALRTVFCMFSSLTTTGNDQAKCVIRIGRHSMSNEHIVENVIDLLHQLQEIHPGGCNNVSKLIIRASSNVGKPVQIYVDGSEPVYPEPEEKSENDNTVKNAEESTNANNMEIDESLLQKIYVHTSIVPSDSIIPDKEDYVINEVRRDNNQVNGQSNNQTSTQKPITLPNIEPQLVRVLKQLIAKTADNSSIAGTGAGTANRGIRRRRVPAGTNRNGRMF